MDAVPLAMAYRSHPRPVTEVATTDAKGESPGIDSGSPAASLLGMERR